MANALGDLSMRHMKRETMTVTWRPVVEWNALRILLLEWIASKRFSTSTVLLVLRRPEEAFKCGEYEHVRDGELGDSSHDVSRNDVEIV